VLSPEILLADEPTGNLDAATSWEIVKLLSDINKKGTTVVMATHNTDIVKSLGKRVIHIEKGKIIKDDKVPPAAKTPDEHEAKENEAKPASVVHSVEHEKGKEKGEKTEKEEEK
jgi:ABC-type methionine transport system ATPase subunit